MSFRLTLEKGTLPQGILAVRRLSELDEEQLMTDIASLGESQTRGRIESGGPAPDGTDWKPNIAGTAILRQTGRNLLDSIASYSTGREAVWGASWEFAHVHQEGATIVPKNAEALSFRLPGNKWATVQKVTIPKREFVGISSDDAREIEDLVTDTLGRLT
jgi:phage gpG-like protein